MLTSIRQIIPLPILHLISPLPFSRSRSRSRSNSLFSPPIPSSPLPFRPPFPPSPLAGALGALAASESNRAALNKAGAVHALCQLKASPCALERVEAQEALAGKWKMAVVVVSSAVVVVGEAV